MSRGPISSIRLTTGDDNGCRLERRTVCVGPERVVALPVRPAPAHEAVHTLAVARRLLADAPPAALKVLFGAFSVARNLE